MNYLTNDGRELFVTDGISGGRAWFTGYRAETGSTRRFKSPVLQCRKTREEAQADLDSYAKQKGLRAAKEAGPYDHRGATAMAETEAQYDPA